jgi:hypothetical protein
MTFAVVCQVKQRSRHFLAYPFATAGTTHEAVRDFCKGLSLAPLGHSFAREDGWWNVWCFATREDAEKFQARWGVYGARGPTEVGCGNAAKLAFNCRRKS